MDCNKEEAIRAKGMAEKKMRAKDFAGAYKLAMKAQQLHASLDNVSQMLMVCKVHCAAEQKLLGNEMDWYGILQVQQTADEVSIKKQYKKFALQLHPDKNQFPGAEAAFKLIGEAQALLLDKGKRSLHDVKRRASVHNPVPPYKYQPGGTYFTNVNSGVQNNARGNFTGVNLQDPRPQQPATGHGISHVLPTFWTMCPFCSTKQQRFIDTINKIVVCSACNKTFAAYQVMPGSTPVPNSNPATFPRRKDVSGSIGCNADVGSKQNFKREDFKFKNSPVKVNGKRRRKHEDSSSSDSSDDSSDSDEEVPIEEDGDFKAKVDVQGSADLPRRSTRSKQQVSYKENLSDDDGDYKESLGYDNGDDEVEDNSKKLKGSGVSFVSQGRTGNRLKEESPEIKKPCGMAAEVTDQEEAKEKVTSDCELKNLKADSTSPSSSNSKHSQYPELFSCPDPEFHDFDGLRNENCFSQGQIWALYDDLDAMPRFYARIVKVDLSPSFKLQIQWLEPSPDDEDERDWVSDDLPAACGKFKHGETKEVENCDVFSHLVYEKGNQRIPYKILPRKGEIWALFRNWEAIWKSGADANRNDYEFAEVLSDFTEKDGARVAFLDKVQGFVSLFCQTNEKSMTKVQIPPGELFRFSHMVPSFRMTGEERYGVPKGSFELDPSALPPTC